MTRKRSPELLALEEVGRRLRETTHITAHEPKDPRGISVKEFLSLTDKLAEEGVKEAVTKKLGK